MIALSAVIALNKSTLSFTASKPDLLTVNHDILEKLQNIPVPELRKLRFGYLSYLEPKHVLGVNRILGNYIASDLQVFVLKGWNYIPIDCIEVGLRHLLPRVKQQVYLQGFTISERMLRMILEESRNSKQLVLMGCKIASLNPEFSIEPDYAYGLQKLSLNQCLSENELHKLNKVSFAVFVKALANTTIKSTLEELFTGGPKQYPVDRISEILTKCDFKARVSTSLLREE